MSAGRDVVLNDPEGQKTNILLYLVRAALYHSLFLKQTAFHQHLDCGQTASHSCQLLHDCLLDSLLRIPKNEAVAPRFTYWWGNFGFKLAECVL